MIVVVDVHAIALPFPIAAAIEVVVGNDPIRIVVEHHAARAVIDPTGDKYFSHVFVAAVRISAPWLDAVVVRIPVAVVGVVRIVPALVFAVVMAGAGAAPGFLLFPAPVLPLVVGVVAVLWGGGGLRRGCLRAGKDNLSK